MWKKIQMKIESKSRKKNIIAMKKKRNYANFRKYCCDRNYWKQRRSWWKLSSNKLKKSCDKIDLNNDENNDQNKSW